jgi:hypothetical protein
MTSTAAAIPPADPAPGTSQVLAEVVRSGFTEGRHHGSLVLLDADGGVALSVGDTTGPVFPRSSNKPMQADAMVRAGLPLEGPRPSGRSWPTPASRSPPCAPPPTCRWTPTPPTPGCARAACRSRC